MEKKLGIIGGMGPKATCELLETIIKYTDASKDQEHIDILLECDSKVPDRSAAILSGGESPVPELIACGKRLIGAGADILVMHCNTSHYFYDDVAAELSVPLFHMPRETAKSIAEAGVKRVGVLATTGTKKAGIYTKALEEEGITTIYPSDGAQELLMRSIYDYVKGFMYRRIVAAIVPNPLAPYDAKPAPKDPQKAFDRRYLLVTPQNYREMIEQYNVFKR